MAIIQDTNEPKDILNDVTLRLPLWATKAPEGEREIQ